jgi:hypothetical protein
VRVLGLPNQFILHDHNPDRLLSHYGLDAAGIAAAARP